MTTRLALTPGEPAGIGPDLTVILAQQPRSTEIVAIANAELLTERAAELKLPLRIRRYEASKPARADRAGDLCVANLDLPKKVNTGTLDSENASYVVNSLIHAIDGCRNREFNALVTGPVHKGVINDAGIPFSGHTELIAQRTDSFPVMMLVADKLRVALATTHLSIASVPAAITEQCLLDVGRVLHSDLISKFAIDHPRILVCGLNPHAGEGGHLGREEIEIIIPALEKLRSEGIDMVGPLPADTLFTPRHLDHADAVLAMYHHQGLPVLKFAGFGSAVNLTLGLPIIRTSVDHGTALDLAGSGQIESGSLQAAITLAQQLVTSQQSVARQLAT